GGRGGAGADRPGVVREGGEGLEARHTMRLAQSCQDRAVTVVLDLDGVVWLADRAIDGAPDAVARLRAGGHRVVFVTNNSFASVSDVEDRLVGLRTPAARHLLHAAWRAPPPDN